MPLSCHGFCRCLASTKPLLQLSSPLPFPPHVAYADTNHNSTTTSTSTACLCFRHFNQDHGSSAVAVFITAVGAEYPVGASTDVPPTPPLPKPPQQLLQLPYTAFSAASASQPKTATTATPSTQTTTNATTAAEQYGRRRHPCCHHSDYLHSTATVVTAVSAAVYG